MTKLREDLDASLQKSQALEEQLQQIKENGQRSADAQVSLEEVCAYQGSSVVVCCAIGIQSPKTYDAM